MSEQLTTGKDCRTGRGGSVAKAAAQFVSDQDTALQLWGAPALKSAVKCQPSQLLTALLGNSTRTLQQLDGAFALALRSKQRTLLAVDRFARIPLYYRCTPDGLQYSPSLTELLKPSDSPDPQAIFQYIFFHMIPSPATWYQDVYRLEPGQVVSWQSGKLTKQRYWQPSFSEDPGAFTSQQACADTLFEKLKAAVAACSQQSEESMSGCFLSGGLDSSGIAGLLARQQAHRNLPTPSFSIGFNEPAYNELQYASLAAKHFQLNSHRQVVTAKEAAQVIPKIISSFEQPFGNSSVVPTYLCARMAKQAGIEHLLAGDGGDELFAGNTRYAKQFIFEHYQRLPAQLRHLISPLSHHLARLWGPLTKVQSYISQASTPLPDRLHSYNFLQRHPATEIFNRDFLLLIDERQPLEITQQIYCQPEPASTLNRMLYLDWQLTLADNDLVKVGSMCQLAGIKVDYPMLDHRVVDFSCTIPSRWKLTPKQLRHLYKTAMRGFLPRSIINKQKHGFGLPFGQWLLQDPDLRAIAHCGLEQVEKTGWFAPGLAQRCLQQNQQHSGYYGELVWVLMVLGLWLKR